MAKAPTCRICGAVHWSTEGHRWGKGGRVDILDQLEAEVVGTAVVERDVTEPRKITAGPERKVTPEPRDITEYLAEQRAKRAAYMRAYRAKRGEG